MALSAEPIKRSKYNEHVVRVGKNIIESVITRRSAESMKLKSTEVMLKKSAVLFSMLAEALLVDQVLC
jgi:hypothetical protein